MAMNSFQLFLSQVKSSPESLRLKNIQIVFDIMMSYEKDLLGENVEIVRRSVNHKLTLLIVDDVEGPTCNIVSDASIRG